MREEIKNGDWIAVGGLQKETEGGCKEKCNNWLV